MNKIEFEQSAGSGSSMVKSSKMHYILYVNDGKERNDADRYFMIIHYNLTRMNKIRELFYDDTVQMM
ncbi:hypothetical protein BLOT_013705 [Blomia tropicalis]|nr:hypothetical protein BLOT_013705 [Blomia tropicalis]